MFQKLVELTPDVFEIMFQKTSAAHPASRQPGHSASTPEASSDTVGVGEQDEGVSGRGVISPQAMHSTARAKKNVQEKLSLLRAATNTCSSVHVFIT